MTISLTAYYFGGAAFGIGGFFLGFALGIKQASPLRRALIRALGGKP